MSIFRFNTWTLKHKLSLLSLVTTGVTLGLLYVVLIVVEAVAGWRALGEQMSVTAETVGRNARSALVFDDPEYALRSLQVLSVQSEVLNAVVYRPDGTSLAEYVNPTYRRDKLPPYRSGPWDGLVNDSLVVVRPIDLEGELVGVISLRAGLGAYIGRVSAYALLLFLLLLLSAVVAYALWSRLQHLILKPVADLVAVVEKVSRDDDYSVRAPAHGKDELGQMIVGFNEMLGQIQARDRQLARHREALESEVERRTQDLVAANRSLQRAKEQAEAANRAKTLFLANMSHEIRNPMNAILGFGKLVSETPLSTVQRGHVERMLTAADSLLGVIDDILDFSKIEANKLELERVGFDPLRVLREVCHLHYPEVKAKGVEMLLSVPWNTPRRVTGDPLRVRQILSNLIGNAMKFTPRGRILVGIEPVSGPDDSLRLRFRVADTGIGMAEQQVDRLFKPFSQVDASHTRQYGGTGLGLAICKRLVDLMKGSLAVTSAVGRGTEFIVDLPFDGLQDAQGVFSPDPRLERLRVLLLHEDPEVRSVLAKILGGLEVGTVEAMAPGALSAPLVDEAESGRSAFDLVLLDWASHTEHGEQDLERIRSVPALRDLPLVVMAGSEIPETSALRAELQSASILVYKPVDPIALHAALLAAMERPQDTALRPVAARQRRRFKSARVLLAEDDPINQWLAKEFLRDFGLDVTIVENGREVVERAKSGRFDVVLMDIHMPKMDGVEAAKTIRRDPTLQDLPIVAVTADAMAENKERCAAVGIDGFLAKPFNPDRLFEMLKRWLEVDEGGVLP